MKQIYRLKEQDDGTYKKKDNGDYDEDDSTLGVNVPNAGTVISTARIDNKHKAILAHELGHACGLNDIDNLNADFGFSGKDQFTLIMEEWLPDDWSGGTGTGYYPDVLTHNDCVDRLIMCGCGGRDLPLGCIYGMYKKADNTWAFGEIWVGLKYINREPTHY